MNSRNRLYRSRRGIILGVCQGLADYWGVPVFWVRLGVIIIACSTGFVPALVAYFLTALILKTEPRNYWY